MLRVYLCVTQHHDLKLVVLAGVLCLFASVTATSMLARTRAVVGRSQLMWLAAASVVAGCGIWATHFVAMLAYEAGMPVGYNLGLTIASIAVAIALCGLGFALALDRTGPLVGGAVTGLAVSSMHYLGMAALETPADPAWNVDYVLASVLVGTVLGAAALWAAAHRSWALRASAPVVLTLAICGMHFTAMSAVVYHYDPRLTMPKGEMEPETLALVVASVAALIVAGGLAGVLVDIRLKAREAGQLRKHVAELEVTQRELEERTGELRAALAAAAEADLAKSRFLAAMSHELRTPLNAILGFSELMAKETFGPHANAQYRDYAHCIHDSGANLLALINSILDLTKLDAGQMELHEDRVDLAALIAEALHAVGPKAREARLVVGSDVAPGIPQVLADRKLLRQVLLKILSNAIKFTPPGGCVHVGVEERDGGIAIDVKDTGIGIDEADVPRAMERFGQVDATLARRYEGSGLGLPLSKQLIELHGGRLTLKSRPQFGTTVSIMLPQARLLRGHMEAA